MDLSLLKNPIILAILAAALTYAYLYWDNMKKKEANPKADIKPVDYTTPAIVGLVSLFIGYSMFGFNNSKVKPDEVGEVLQNSNKPSNLEESAANLMGGVSKLGTNFSDKLADSFDSNTYHLIGKNAIRLPNTDVFIDLAKF